MTIDFLIGAIRASQDLHPQVKTELEEILYKAEHGADGRGKVRKGLECCARCTNDNPFDGCDECPYNEISVSVQECRSVLCMNALEMMKPIKPIVCMNGEWMDAFCGECNQHMYHALPIVDTGEYPDKPDFCSYCGRPVDWP